jgi:hypothetical protein
MAGGFSQAVDSCTSLLVGPAEGPALLGALLDFWLRSDGPGPSSYKAVASIAECPSKLSVHEFVAHQNVSGGKNRRWLSILKELGSSNINFSLKGTMILFRSLAQQAGPSFKDDNLRAVHYVFRDAMFCDRLMQEIEQHLEAISANWRESHYKETLLTLTIQLCALYCLDTRSQAHALLLKIRHITLAWTTDLRSEMRYAQEADTAESTARYCFLSALLCRRTFVAQTYGNQEMDGERFKSFVEATLTFQESLVVDLDRFSIATRNILVRDIKMTVVLRPRLREEVTRHQTSLESAIDTCWPSAEFASRQYAKWEVNGWWVMSTVQATEFTVPQVVHYHLLEGHLLVDGQTMGKLPADIRDSDTLKALFGNQRLVAYPSNMYKMSYMLAANQEGRKIHLGYRKEKLVIRAQTLGRTLS